MKKYIINLNDGCYYDGDKNVFNYNELIEVFKKEIGDEKLLVEDGEYDLEEGIKVLMEGSCEVMNNGFIEYGDDYSEMSIVELSE